MRETRQRRCIFKGSVPEISEQLLAPIAGDEQVRKTICIVIPDSHSKRVTDSVLDSSLLGYGLKVLLGRLPKKSVCDHDGLALRCKLSAPWHE